MKFLIGKLGDLINCYLCIYLGEIIKLWLIFNLESFFLGLLEKIENEVICNFIFCVFVN